MQKLIVIVGPTSSGKTALAIAVARAIRGEVVSADSRQVFRGLDLGTGKVTRAEARGIPHHLISVADPKRAFSADRFTREARRAIVAIAERGKVPIMAGGTGFYIDAALGRVVLSGVPANPALRKKLNGWSPKRLADELKRIDPVRSRAVDTKNPRRLIRAIEIARGKQQGTLKSSAPAPAYETLWLGLSVPRPVLAERIRKRLKDRLKAGMLQEAQRLHRAGLSYKRMQGLGLEYRFMAHHLQGNITYEEMVRELEKAIRQYAKRQMTWFGANKEIRWLLPREKTKAIQLVRTFLKM